MLNAVRGFYAQPATDMKRRRPSRFAREDLLRVDSRRRDLLSRETSVGCGVSHAGMDQITLTLQRIVRRRERVSAKKLRI